VQQQIESVLRFFLREATTKKVKNGEKNRRNKKPGLSIK